MPCDSFTWVSDTRIDCVTGASGAGVSGPPVITTFGGDLTSFSAPVAATTFTYNEVPTVDAVTPSFGPDSSGTTLEITGTNFGGSNIGQVTSVAVGAFPCESFAWVSATRLTCDTPSSGGSGSGLVAASIDSVAAASTAVYTWLPPPAVTLLSRTFGPVEGGTVVRRPAGKGEKGGGAFIWVWKDLGAFIWIWKDLGVCKWSG